jgi:hypothetical protein
MKSETRRPEDEPQFDEHANEDSYFAAKEHELVEDMKFEFHDLKQPGGKRRWRLVPSVQDNSRSTDLWDSI